MRTSKHNVELRPDGLRHGVVPASVTRRSQDWTGHRLGGMKPGAPVKPLMRKYALAARLTSRLAALATDGRRHHVVATTAPDLAASAIASVMRRFASPSRAVTSGSASPRT